MSADEKIFKDFKEIDRSLSLANSNSMKISGIGKIQMKVNDGKCDKTLKLDRVLYVDDLRINLLLVSKITDRGYEVKFRKKDAVILDVNGEVLMKADRIGDLYYVGKSRGKHDWESMEFNK